MKLVTPLEELAHVVDELERNDVQVEEASASHSNDGCVRARVRIEIPISAGIDEDGSVDDVVDAAREVVSPVEIGGEEAPTGQDAYQCDECGFTSDSSQGLAIHTGRMHEPDDDPSPSEPPVRERILSVMESEGELSGAEIETLTGAKVWDRLSELVGEGEVQARKDPDDGRRKLYSIDEGGVPCPSDDCDFVGATEGGLKTHRTWRHVHGNSSASINEADVYDAAEKSDSVDAVAEKLGVDADTAGELLETHGFLDKLEPGASA